MPFHHVLVVAFTSRPLLQVHSLTSVVVYHARQDLTVSVASTPN